MTARIGLRQVEELARQLGASEAKVLPAREVVVDERVRLKCLVPRCAGYGQSLLCPPALPTVEEFRQVLRRYQWALVVQVKGSTGAESGEPDRQVVYDHSKALHQLINKLEARLQGQGFVFAAGFIGGACRLCDECVGQASGKPCRHPFQSRPAMEGMGIDVVATLARVGLTIAPFPIGEEVVWTGLLLLD